MTTKKSSRRFRITMLPPGARPPGGHGRFRRLGKVLGPGFVTGASDDDPSGIGTYAQAGASLGYATLWTAPFTFPLMAAVQFICAKIGMVSGMGLAGVLRTHYARGVLWPAVALLFVANTINAGADIGAIAAAINLLAPALPIREMVVPVALVILAVQVWGSYRLIARVFKWLTVALLAYIASAFFARPDWHQVVTHTLVPTIRLDATYLTTLVALLGTTISPYLFFWQANQEVEEERAMGRTTLEAREGATDGELRDAALDVNVGMFFSNVVAFFIMLATAATLHVAGRTAIASAADAAVALRPIAGDGATLLLAIGLVGSGFLAVPVLTASAAFATCEAANWECGLNDKPGEARRFYAVMGTSTALGVAMNFLGLNPMAALFWTAVINGLLAPPLMVLLMRVSNDRRVMGERVNGRALNVLGWVATAVMTVAALGLAASWLIR